MTPPRETEIKLAVQDPRTLRRRLAELQFRLVQPRRFESNTLFDFPNLRLRKSRSLLRVRVVDGKTLVTFKGAPLVSRRYKVRPEVETKVEDADRLREIFRGLGLRECFRYEKYRTVYAQRGLSRRVRRPLLMVDETPIGNYLELEGPERWIDRMARELGYRPEDYITASYVALYVAKCHERGVEPRNMSFSASPKC